MSFHLSTWSIKNPIAVLVTFITLGTVGIMSFLGLGIDSNPNIDVPAVMVTVTQQGAGPTELETQVTKKVEDAVAGLGDIDQIISTVTDGRSTTTINFILGTDSDQATNDVRNAIAQIRQDLPQDINDPTIQKVEFAGGAIITYAVSSDQRSVEYLSDLVDRQISRALLNIEGVAQVSRVGGVDREIRVDLDPSRLLAYGITATEVNQQIRNFNIDLPGGRAELGGGEQNVRTLGSAETVTTLQNYPIILNNGDTVLLSDLGTVRDGHGDPRQSAYLNGKPVVGFSILRSTGSTVATVEKQVREVVAQLEKELPKDIQFKLIFTLADYIQETYQGTIDSLISGCILTIITVGVFLKDWRATIITSLALPLSILPTFSVMQALNYTLNGMTLLALALAIGNLVDDAVCMIENIDQHLQMGKSPLKAAWDGSVEIGLAVVATTATIVAVFLPVAFMGGIPGQFFQPFGVTVAVSTMFSSLAAITITPMLSAYWFKDKKNPKNVRNAAKNKRFTPYRSLLIWSLRHRITTVLLAIAFFIGSLQLVPYIPKGLFTEGDDGLSLVSIELPPGSTLKETESVVFRVKDALKANPAVDSILANVGDENVTTALMYVNLKPKTERTASLKEFETEVRPIFQKIPGARVTFSSRGAGGGSKDVSILLTSENPQSLTQTAMALEEQMRALPGLTDVSSSVSLVKPEVIIEPDPVRATDLGVSVQAIAQTASLAFLGDNEFNLAKFNLPDRQIPIRVKIQSNEREDINTLRNLRIPGKNGALVPLSSVATIRLGSGPAEIKRFDRSRQVEIGGNLQGIALGDALNQVRNLPAMNPLPSDVNEVPVGDAKIMRDIFTRFGSALGLAVLAIYGILVLLYSNFLYPLVIMASMPLSVGGALLALMIAQKELALFALIGIVLLMGLVTKNAILLVDLALAATKEGKPLYPSIVEAGVSRLRPIVMTTLSTIVGMLPIALEMGADGEVRSPMAIAVIGGLTTSTLLTLVVVPVVFSYISNFYHWISRLWLGSSDERKKLGY